MEFSQSRCQFIPLRSKHSSQHPVFKYSQSVLFP
jgi:hypothetical protein